jgi:hypothetical protein
VFLRKADLPSTSRRHRSSTRPDGRPGRSLRVLAGASKRSRLRFRILLGIDSRRVRCSAPRWVEWSRPRCQPGDTQRSARTSVRDVCGFRAGGRLRWTVLRRGDRRVDVRERSLARGALDSKGRLARGLRRNAYRQIWRGVAVHDRHIRGWRPGYLVGSWRRFLGNIRTVGGP